MDRDSAAKFSLPLMLCAAAFAQDAQNAGFRALRIDAGKVIGEIRSFLGVRTAHPLR